MNFKIPFAIGLSLLLNNAFTQSSPVSAGGDASSLNGSVSYSIGQVNYISVTELSGNLNQGNQQPYEFYLINSLDEVIVEPTITVFPNPTRESVSLKLQALPVDQMSYELYDQLGNLVSSQNILAQETKIEMVNLAMAGYVLKVVQNNKVIKSFQIIKNF